MVGSKKNLPDQITSRDLLKSLALVLMVADHLGSWFYPEMKEFRAVGRLSAPLWFFLIGFSNSHRFSWSLLIAGILVEGIKFLDKGEFLYLNILFTFLLIRPMVRPIAQKLRSSVIKTFILFSLLAPLTFPVSFLFEYGTLGFLFAIIGYQAKHRDALGWNRGKILIVSFFAGIIYCCHQNLAFRFDEVWSTATFGGMAALSFLFSRFRSATFPDLTARLCILKYLLFLFGRRSLELYVLHLAAFLLIKTYLQLQGFYD